MILSAPWTEYIDIIDLQTLKTLLYVNQMRFSDPWSDFIENIALLTIR